MAELAREEIESIGPELNRLTQELKVLLLPKDPLDEKNVMLEVSFPGPLYMLCNASVCAIRSQR